jgi:hypothetical protein
MIEKPEFESNEQKHPKRYNNPPEGFTRTFSGQPLSS